MQNSKKIKSSEMNEIILKVKMKKGILVKERKTKDDKIGEVGLTFGLASVCRNAFFN